jgi:hypothetical protein
MTKFYTIAIVGFISLNSCKTASKAYQKGDYTEAIELGVKKLQKNPGDNDTKELVKTSYSYEVSQHEDAIRTLSNSKNESRYESIYKEYVHLQHLYETIHQYPAVAQLINATDYSEYVETYRGKAADIHFEKGTKWMDEGTKTAYREAYKEFNVALRYRPDDFELKKRRDQAFDAALIKVVIAPLQNYGGYNYSYSYKLQNFQNDILRTLSYNMNDGFIRFYSEWEAKNKDIEPDQIMELNLSRITIGQPYDDRSTREVSKEVVIKEIVYKPDSVVKQYGTVKARITTTKRTLASEADLYITVRDTKGRIIWQDRFTGDHRWQTEFSTYTGDERALTDGDKSLVNQTHATSISEDQVMDELLRKIQSDLSYRLRSYYTRYQ